MDNTEIEAALSSYTKRVVKAVGEGYSLAIADADGFLNIIQQEIAKASIDEVKNMEMCVDDFQGYAKDRIAELAQTLEEQ